VLAAGALQKTHGLLWLAMITSAAHAGWPGDVEISDLDGAGLPAPSIVRAAKIATIHAEDASWLGKLPVGDREPLRLYIRERLDDLVWAAQPR
jgi:mRNA interferase MazF